jgi:hypothetical protein
MEQIPRIIHQIWSGIDEPLPKDFRVLGETWKEHYPAWKYELWNNERMNGFVRTYYPQHWDVYQNYPYNVQRWDAIRYLILDKIGGLYVDFDYESIEPMNSLIEGKTCCFALEPQAHCFYFKKRIIFNNALMLSIPGHPFMKKIIETVFSPKMLEFDISSKRVVCFDSSSNIVYEYNTSAKNDCVMKTTGPWILMDLYNHLSEDDKKDVYLIPAKYVSPFDSYQAELVRSGIKAQDLEDCLAEAYAVHYFFSNWRKNNK